ncbi:helix-turn-helix transcriptional regulator [Nostocaceae cyanobacterium CENA369]|uniref:Helix-turn-helix transcriptional regulator n=1 Tax=Dendronalium phyllosphericum CENA369 TaxID=1725256 RepID=A0A8J7I7J8_9NOST|nr:helix-turn-helix transcriptional regulator [Dendronalium phyllosphericum]MBH8576974.1 helix-turn-helix transcriptional regulator [Dendronalium phyllosphericum CENA369]
MNPRSRRQKQESDSPLDALRIERTKLTQDELAMRCGIPRATYQRWISGKTEARLTMSQVKSLCRELGIERVEDLPDDFGPPNRS